MEETQKIDKRTKAYKTNTETQVTMSNTGYELLKENGIQLAKVVLHDAVVFDGNRELAKNSFVDQSYGNMADKQHGRTAKIWYTPHGVLIERNNQRKLLPLDAIKDDFVL